MRPAFAKNKKQEANPLRKKNDNSICKKIKTTTTGTPAMGGKTTAVFAKKHEQTPPLWEENGNVFAKTLFACIDACQRGQNVKTRSNNA